MTLKEGWPGKSHCYAVEGTPVAHRTALRAIQAFAVLALGTAAGLVLSLIVANLLGPSGSGVFFLGVTLVSVGSTIARMGIDNVVLRHASIAVDRQDGESIRALYAQGVGLTATCGILLTVLVWELTPRLFLPTDSSAASDPALKIIGLAIVPLAILAIQGEFLKARAQANLATALTVAIPPTLMLLGTAALALASAATTVTVAMSYSATLWLCACIAMFVAHARCNLSITGIDIEEASRLLRESAPYFWVAVMNLLMTWTDMLVLGLSADAAEIGIYGLASRLAGTVMFVLVATNAVVAPRFAALYGRKDFSGLQALASRSTMFMTLAASPIMIVLMIFPGVVLGCFGAGFEAGADQVRILVLGQFVNVAMGSVGYLLMMTGRGRLLRNAIAVTAALNVVGNVVLVPRLGGLGAAISTAACTAMLNIIAYVLVFRHVGVNTLAYFHRSRSSWTP